MSAMRRPTQLGQSRPLQLKATRRSKPHSGQRRRAKPRAGIAVAVALARLLQKRLEVSADDGVGERSFRARAGGSPQRAARFFALARWLSDGIRLLQARNRHLQLIDTRTGDAVTLWMFGDGLVSGLSMPSDNSAIYFATQTTDADIWLAEPPASEPK